MKGMGWRTIETVKSGLRGVVDVETGGTE
jgi:hypothetical protein